ncbi:MAG: hypothetical protein ACOYT9_04595 [Patescibacteria group bacterium]
MNPTDFWFKLVDMTQSDKAVVSLGGRDITEKQVIWIIGLSLLLVFLVLLRWAIMWVLGGPAPKTAKETEKKVETPIDPNVAATAPQPTIPTTPAPSTTTPPAPTPVANTQTPAPTTSQTGSPQDLLADTSDRKRTLHDYVTPDTIHTEVMKQTLNNDYPYQTLKPDPAKIVAQVAAPTAQTPTAPDTTVQAAATPAPVQPNTTTSAVSEVIAPVVAEVTPITTAPAPPTPESTMPAPLPEVVTVPSVASAPVSAQPPVDMPATSSNTEQMQQQVAVEPVTPSQPTNATTLPPLPQAQAPIATPTAVPPQPAVTTVAPPQLQDTAKQTPTVLPPLPPSEPKATMIVGVADTTGTPAVSKVFNPTDPALP